MIQKSRRWPLLVSIRCIARIDVLGLAFLCSSTMHVNQKLIRRSSQCSGSNTVVREDSSKVRYWQDFYMFIAASVDSSGRDSLDQSGCSVVQSIDVIPFALVMLG